MSKIKLDDNYSLDNDKSNWSLHYKKVGDVNEATGKQTVSTDTWYCGSLEGCLNRYINEATKPCLSAGEILAKLAEIKSIIQS